MSEINVSPGVQRTAPASPIIPGNFVQQGLSIQERLQVPFPPSLFTFRVLPPRVNAKVWGKLVTGDQPFIGLGFDGFRPGAGTTSAALRGDAAWVVITSVRHGQATDRSRYYGDKYGIGALTVAEVAASVLHNHNAPSGRVQVNGLANVATDWDDDAVIVKLDLTIPTTLQLDNAILQPAGLGWFDVLASQYAWAAQNGDQATYYNQWSNPNAQPTD